MSRKICATGAGALLFAVTLQSCSSSSENPAGATGTVPATGGGTGATVGGSSGTSTNSGGNSLGGGAASGGSGTATTGGAGGSANGSGGATGTATGGGTSGSQGGGTASGGASLGGNATGGKAAGGNANQGGSSKGGSAAGGNVASGGATTGGVAAGGAATGGATTAGGAGTCPADTATYASPVTVAAYKVGGPLWKQRLKKLIVTWVPYVYNQLSDLALAEGGIANFVEAGKKIKGQSAAQHAGLWFSNAYVLNTVEAMAAALLLDPEGDSEITAAQTAIKAKLADWIPKILSAQESDGYLDTIITLGSAQYGNPGRWKDRFFHEGYVAGYFIEAAIVHQIATGDASMYNAAKKLADLWVAKIGPAPKLLWWDGHEEMEQALTRFARYVDEKEGAGKGDSYAQLAKFLLDSRGKAGPGTDPDDPGQNSPEYDQHQAPPLNQTTAVGHAVRALYLYSGMADVALTTGTAAYLTAADKIWDNLVNRKMYVNGCTGAGDAQSAAEGFGPDYWLPNVSYCESCGACGMLFFQHKMMLAHKDGRYADLGEMAIYNTMFGSIDLMGSNFEYRNPLDQTTARYKWHPCPCCVGNVPKTLLQIPSWAYAKTDASLYVNLFLQGTSNVGSIGGTNVSVTQVTDYPWKGTVSIAVNPASAKAFALRIRVPDRSVSTLYSGSPDANGITSISVNGASVSPTIDKGYATICRTWAAGDKVDIVLPMAVQRVKAVSQVQADVGRVALQYGPMIYNIENVDHSNTDVDTFILKSDAALTAEWNGSLLDGVNVIKGKFSNGTAMTAIPYYTRMNRGGSRSIVWVKDN